MDNKSYCDVMYVGGYLDILSLQRKAGKGVYGGRQGRGIRRKKINSEGENQQGMRIVETEWKNRAERVIVILRALDKKYHNIKAVAGQALGNFYM